MTQISCKNVDVTHVVLYTHMITWYVLLGIHTTHVAVWGIGLELKESFQMIKLYTGNNTLNC